MNDAFTRSYGRMINSINKKTGARKRLLNEAAEAGSTVKVYVSVLADDYSIRQLKEDVAEHGYRISVNTATEFGPVNERRCPALITANNIIDQRSFAENLKSMMGLNDNETDWIENDLDLRIVVDGQSVDPYEFLGIQKIADESAHRRFGRKPFSRRNIIKEQASGEIQYQAECAIDDFDSFMQALFKEVGCTKVCFYPSDLAVYQIEMVCPASAKAALKAFVLKNWHSYAGGDGSEDDIIDALNTIQIEEPYIRVGGQQVSFEDFFAEEIAETGFQL